MYLCVYIYIYVYGAPNKSLLSASQSLSETLPCTGYKAFSLKGQALKGNHVARIGI